MIIRKFRSKDAKDVCKIVSKSFKEFVAHDFTKTKANEWLKEMTPNKQIERAKTRDVYVAIIKNKIVGMIEAVPNKRISRLFVDKKYHNKSIASSLLKSIERLYYRRGARKITVWSSLYAVKFYEKRGYKKSRRIIRKDGAVYQPMIKTIG